MDALIRPSVLIGLIVVGFLLGGFIDARVPRLHPAEHRRPGGVVRLGGISRESLAHQGRWLRFIWYEHFRAHDTLLSIRCVSAGVLQIAFFSMLLITG
ncbi:MAG TPA: hypothetical protein VMW19_16690 [Myxococcota bacterium]|nr:hypothetical protein [Myxococcota bacterium]